jgi:GNAT superfamily N-acetyltransferase
MPIEIREHTPGTDIDDFIRAGRVVFRGDPAWVEPLDMDIRGRLTPAKNPFFLRGEVTLFTAWKNGELVGRCSAQLDHEHLRIYQDKTGFFGFFDTIDDDEVGRALLEAAAEWLRRRGMERMRGPLSLNINEEVGVLIEGHEHPPAILMGHSRAWQDRIALAAGLEKAKDFFAWRFYAGRIPKRALRAWEQVREMPEVRLRTVDPKKMERELGIIMSIFNDAWKDNWGFVPATPAEVKKMGEEMRLIIDREIALIAEIDDKPVGVCVMLPNVNEIIRDFDGKLGPVQLAKLLWRLKVKRPKTARLMLLGISGEIRGVKKYGALSHSLYVQIAKSGEKLGYEWGELSWTLEDNHRINLGIKSMGASVYKKYRVYERALTA